MKLRLCEILQFQLFSSITASPNSIVSNAVAMGEKMEQDREIENCRKQTVLKIYKCEAST